VPKPKSIQAFRRR